MTMSAPREGTKPAAAVVVAQAITVHATGTLTGIGAAAAAAVALHVSREPPHVGNDGMEDRCSQREGEAKGERGRYARQRRRQKAKYLTGSHPTPARWQGGSSSSGRATIRVAHPRARGTASRHTTTTRILISLYESTASSIASTLSPLIAVRHARPSSPTVSKRNAGVQPPYPHAPSKNKRKRHTRRALGYTPLPSTTPRQESVRVGVRTHALGILARSKKRRQLTVCFKISLARAVVVVVARRHSVDGQSVSAIKGHRLPAAHSAVVLDENVNESSAFGRDTDGQLLPPGFEPTFPLRDRWNAADRGFRPSCIDQTPQSEEARRLAPLHLCPHAHDTHRTHCQNDLRSPANMLPPHRQSACCRRRAWWDRLYGACQRLWGTLSETVTCLETDHHVASGEATTRRQRGHEYQSLPDEPQARAATPERLLEWIASKPRRLYDVRHPHLAFEVDLEEETVECFLVRSRKASSTRTLADRPERRRESGNPGEVRLWRSITCFLDQERTSDARIVLWGLCVPGLDSWRLILEPSAQDAVTVVIDM